MEGGRKEGRKEGTHLLVCVSPASFVGCFALISPSFPVPSFLADPAQIKTQKTTIACASVCWCVSSTSRSPQEAAVLHSQPLTDPIPGKFAQI